MVAAIDWCSHTTHDWFGWLVVLGLTALETVFQSISGRLPKSEEEKRKDRREKKISKQPPPAPTASAIDPCPL